MECDEDNLDLEPLPEQIEITQVDARKERAILRTYQVAPEKSGISLKWPLTFLVVVLCAVGGNEYYQRQHATAPQPQAAVIEENHEYVPEETTAAVEPPRPPEEAARTEPESEPVPAPAPAPAAVKTIPAKMPAAAPKQSPELARHLDGLKKLQADLASDTTKQKDLTNKINDSEALIAKAKTELAQAQADEIPLAKTVEEIKTIVWKPSRRYDSMPRNFYKNKQQRLDNATAELNNAIDRRQLVAANLATLQAQNKQLDEELKSVVYDIKQIEIKIKSKTVVINDLKSKAGN